MSLIQEALRRQQQEMEAANQDSTKEPTDTRETTPTVVPPPPPMEPPPPPEPETPETPEEDTDIDAPLRRQSSEKEHRVMVPMLITLLVLLLLSAFVVWAAMIGFRLFYSASDAPSETVVEAPLQEPEVATESPASEVAVAAPVTEEPVVITPPGLPDAAGEAPVATPETQPETPDTVTEVIRPLPPMPEEQTTPDTEPAPPPEPVIWPEIYVAGVIGAGESGSAIINGKVYGMNEQVGDLAVITRDFGKGFVMLEYQGETRRFPVGRAIR
jgi:hypothetical protein